MRMLVDSVKFQRLMKAVDGSEVMRTLLNCKVEPEGCDNCKSSPYDKQYGRCNRCADRSSLVHNYEPKVKQCLHEWILHLSDSDKIERVCGKCDVKQTAKWEETNVKG